ncbi:MAG: penicillin-binding transpeptidase domain-containing protein [Acidimicrobiia bacterium]|nr:penicillin-binding transpeptidase domain-containing protein [Acidimicrobiia bacterium]
MIDDPWIDVSIEEPTGDPARRPAAPWGALALGVFTAGLIVALGWTALSMLDPGTRALVLDPDTSSPAEVSTTGGAPASTTTEPTRRRTAREELWDRALADAGAAAAIIADEVTSASEVWESGEADFPTTRARFTAASERAADAGAALAATTVPEGTDRDAVEDLLALFDDLAVAASDAALGLDAPDDGGLRRTAVARTTAVTASIEGVIGDLRAALPDPEPGEAIVQPGAGEPTRVLAADGSVAGWIGDDGTVTDDSPLPAVVESAMAAAIDTAALGPDPVGVLAGGGVEIVTGIDPRLQVQAERVLERWFDADPDTPKGGVAVVDVDSGAVLAIAERRATGDGGAHYALHRRRPGSVFKAFAFVAALEQGIDPDAPRDARTPVTLDTPTGPWTCFDPVPDPDASASLTEAIVTSLNTVFCRLAVDLGPDRIVRAAGRLGVESPIASIPSVVLGSEKVSPLEMAGSFATIARSGLRIDPWLVDRVVATTGGVLWERSTAVQRAVDPTVADGVIDALEEVVARGTGTLADVGRPQFGKTGSPIEGTDAWFVGATARTAGAVWVGSVDPDRPMGPSVLDGREYAMVYGGPVAAPIWAEIVSLAEQDVPAASFP